MAISELGRIGQWGTSTPRITPTPLSGRNSATRMADGGMSFAVEFCMPSSFSPTTPMALRFYLDNTGEQGGQKIAEVPISQVSGDATQRCFRAAYQLSPAQIAQHIAASSSTSASGERTIHPQVYIDGVLQTFAALVRKFAMKSSQPAPSITNWPNPNPTTTALQPQAPAPELKRDVQVVAPIVTGQAPLAPAPALAPTLAPSVQAAAAALAPTPSAVKASEPTPAIPATAVKESGSLLPTTLLPKGAVQLPVKSGFGVGAYAAMGVAALAGFWWWKMSKAKLY